MTSRADRDLDAVVSALEALCALEGDADADADADVGAGGVSDAEPVPESHRIVRFLAALGTVRVALDTVALRRIAALERARSADPDSDPVRAGGHRDVGSLLAELWKTTLPAARQLCAVSRAISPRQTLTGESVPAEFPDLAAALLADGADSGGGSGSVGEVDHAGSPYPRVSVEQAAAIIRELEKTGPGCTLEQRSVGERVLIEHAPGLTVEQMRRSAVQVRDQLDADGTEPREQILRRRRSLTITTTREGMTHLDWFLDAESAGYVLPQITAYVSAEQRDTREPGMPEQRSLAQLRCDGAVDVFRHRAGCVRDASRAPVTMIVRIALSDLRTGLGTAEIDEVPLPVGAGTARRLAADAHLIPVVLGGRSEVLDLGRKQRLFSPAQKYALAERDGGCAWSGCPHPPSYTQAHHIRWWDRDAGTTDLENGILLCSHHHHRVHQDGWGIRVLDNVPWFIPPAHLDASRSPRRGGRVRVPNPDPP